jgi:3-phosphoshikimate 1-carboxyvinyltransferase
MGARLSCRENRFTPLTIEGTPLHGISYELPVASAQVKSCLLFAGLLAEGETRIVEPQPTRDHSERMLAASGAEVASRPAGEGVSARMVVVQPASRLGPEAIVIPGDISSAAFFAAAALLVPGSEVELEGVGINPTRTGLLAILERMGAEIEVEAAGETGGEPSGTLSVRAASLRGTEVGGAEVPLAIDELPLVALAACFAEGTTTIRDAAELRRKESDRIATVSEALNALGGRVEPTEDGMVVEGTGGLRGGRMDSHGDHRIAMLGAVAGLASREGVEVDGMDAAAVSYPGFEADLAGLVGSRRPDAAANEQDLR